MKNFLYCILLSVALLLNSCTGNPGYNTDRYTTITGPSGQQMVVVTEDNGQQYLMPLTNFQTLMNTGGYDAVMNSRNLFIPYTNTYRSWNTSYIPRQTFNYYRQKPVIVRESRSKNYTVPTSYRQNSFKSPSTYQSIRKTPSSFTSPKYYSKPSSLSSPKSSFSLKSSSSSKSSLSSPKRR